MDADFLQAIFTRSRPNDQKISQDLTKVSQILWENLFPHPNPDPAESIIATRLSTLYSWFRSQPRAFLPDTSTFDINNDALQKANIRLSHAAYFGAIILLSRFPLIRSIERGDLPRDTAQSQRESASGRRKGELDDLQYAEGCIDAAYNAVNHVHTLISQKSHSGSTGLAFSDNDATVKDIGSCRMVLGVFFISVLTILLHISLQSAQTMDARQNDVLEKISQVIAEMDLNTDVQDMSRQHRARLRTFLDAISARSSSHYSNYSASFRPPSSDSISPLGISGKRLTADLIHMLQQPQGGVDWLAYHSPLWCWKDLLTTPGALPVGGRLIEPSPKNSDRTLRSASGESGSTPPRGLDKRAKRDLSTGVASDVESLFEGDRKSVV